MSNEANIKRLAEIQAEITALTDEGVRIADEEKVCFSLANAAFTRSYGSGGMAYVPEGAKTDRWGDPIDPDDDYNEDDTGWITSNSQGC